MVKSKEDTTVEVWVLAVHLQMTGQKLADKFKRLVSKAVDITSRQAKPHLVPCEVGTDSTFDLRSVWCYKGTIHSIPENKEGQLTCTGHTETSVV